MSVQKVSGSAAPSESGGDWKGVLIKALAGGAIVAVGGALYLKYFKNSESAEAAHSQFTFQPSSMNVKDISLAQFQHILKAILESQKETKKLMRQVSDEITSKNLSYLDTYNKVKQMNMIDPLKRFNIDMNEFSELLSIHCADPTVKQVVFQLTQQPIFSGGNEDVELDEKILEEEKKMVFLDDNGLPIDENVPELDQRAKSFGIRLPINHIIKIHLFTSYELSDIVQQIEPGMQGREATVAAQAYIGKLVQQKYNVSPEMLEKHVNYFHTQLSQNNEFIEVGSTMRAQINDLMEKCMQPAQQSEQRLN